MGRYYIFAIIILKKNNMNQYVMERFFNFDFHNDVCI